MLVHANNPHGFAHQRRVNEDNIDLNRNFIDFDAETPESPGYAELHPALVPEAWDGPVREAADAAIEAYKVREGLPVFQQVTSRGQYTFPDGLFFGGTGPSWSRQTIEGFAVHTSGLQSGLLWLISILASDHEGMARSLAAVVLATLSTNGRSHGTAQILKCCRRQLCFCAAQRHH